MPTSPDARSRLIPLLMDDGLPDRVAELDALRAAHPEAWAELQDLAVLRSVVSEERAVRTALSERLEALLGPGTLRERKADLDVLLRARRSTGLPGFREHDPDGWAAAWTRWQRPGAHDRYVALLRGHPGLATWLLEVARAHRVYRRDADAVDVTLGLAETWRVHRKWDELGEAASVVSQLGVMNEARPELLPVVMAWLGEVADHSEKVRPWATVMAGHLAGFYGGDLQAARRWYRRAIAASPKHPAPHNDLAWLLLDQEGPSDEALGHARQAAVRAPKNPSVQHTVGLLEWKAPGGDPAAAARWLEAAASHDKSTDDYKASWAAFQAASQAESG